MATPIFTISTARQKLFDLFQAVTSRPGRKVVISSRGAANHAVLVEAAYLSELESAAARLREMQTSQGMPAGGFRLVGSGRIGADSDDPLAKIRAEAAASADNKLASPGKHP